MTNDSGYSKIFNMHRLMRHGYLVGVTPQSAQDRYEAGGIYKKICDAPVFDAMNNGIEWDGAPLDDEIIEKLTTAAVISRATGGAVVVFFIDDKNTLDMPIDDGTASRIYRIRVYSAAEAVPEALITDIESEHYGEVEKYRITDMLTGQSFVANNERCVVFNGITTTGGIMARRNGWGGCVLDDVRAELDRYDTISQLTVSILSRISQGVLTIPGLSYAIAHGKADEIRKYIHEIDDYRSVMDTMVIDGGGGKDGLPASSFSMENMTLSGLGDIIEQSQTALSAVSKIPATILFGKSPDGQNSTGKADFENYFGMLKRIQNFTMNSAINDTIEICKRCKIETADAFRFNNPKNISEQDAAEIGLKKSQALKQSADALIALHEAGVLDDDEISEYLDKKTDAVVNHEYGNGDD